MRKVGKKSVLLSSALIATLIMMPMINPAQAYVNQWIWKDFVYRGYDNYYGYIFAYLNGSTATVKVPVYNDDDYNYLNVTVVTIAFYDVNINKTLNITGNPTSINYSQTKYFDVSFTADVGELANEWAHEYMVCVKVVYSGGYTTEWAYYWNYYYGYRIVVYTQDQKDLRDLYIRFWAYEDSMPPYYFDTVKGSLLATQAVAEAETGDSFYNIGKWTDAKTHYQTAVDLYDQALSIEEEKGVAIEDAYLNATITEADAAATTADAATLQAQAAMNQSYGYILLGIGIILVGFGAILYGMKKPKPVPT